MLDSDIVLSYRVEIDPDVVDDFINIVSVPNLRLSIDERQEICVYAALEWIVPTAIFVYISKSYFDGFLKEMGKDHYHLLKNAIKATAKKLLGPSGPRVAKVSSGKVSKDDMYSLVYSVVAEVGERKKI